MTSALHFCDREQELQQLVECWNKVSDLNSLAPHLVVIKGERGLGKTRLALEFYRWLSQNQAAQGHGGYWPNALSVVGRNLEVNPDPRLCNFALPIPYLWWGVRCADPEAENSVAGDAIASHDRLIHPHLVTLSLRARMESGAISLGKAWLTVGIDAAANALQVDTVLSVGKAISESIKIIKGGLDESSPDRAGSAASKCAISRSDALLVDLEKIFNPALSSFARTPGVLFVDDAQFCANDPALPSFLERLLKLASTQKWPVLILATHWRREFLGGKSARESQNSLPQIIARAGNDDSGLFVREIDLGVVADLSPALRERFTGLTHDQHQLILERVGGNPRFLEQITALMSESEDYFIDIDTSQALTDEGLVEILEATPDIFTTVMRRLRAAPEEVQQALGLASAQGMQFLPRIVAEMGIDLVGQQLTDHLAAAEDPYSMVLGPSSGAPVGVFSERLLQEVATKRRRSLASLGGEQQISNALRQRLCKLLDYSSTELGYSEDELLVAYRLSRLVFGDMQGNPDKHRFEEASVRLIALERSRASHESAVTLQTQLYKVESVPASQAFQQCWQAAGSHIQDSAITSRESLIWIKTDLHPPLMEHLSFRIKNQIFLVRIIDADGKVDTQGTIPGLVHHAQEWNGVPCLLPMRLENGKWRPENSGWGLINALDNTMLDPPELVSDLPVEMTEWELYDFAVMCVRKHIENNLGKHVTSYSNNPLIKPSIFFMGEKGLEWVVVRVGRNEKGGQRPEDAMLTQAVMRDQGYPIGHFASLGVVSSDGPFKPLIRGAGMHLYFEGFEPFWDGQPMLITEGSSWEKIRSAAADT